MANPPEVFCLDFFFTTHPNDRATLLALHLGFSGISQLESATNLAFRLLQSNLNYKASSFAPFSLPLYVALLLFKNETRYCTTRLRGKVDPNTGSFLSREKFLETTTTQRRCLLRALSRDGVGFVDARWYRAQSKNDIFSFFCVVGWPRTS